jgi:Phytanoyl-CoA dioxygenase (PhyH)
MTQPANNLATDGATVVRGFLTPGEAANLRRTVDEIYAAMDSCEHFPNALFENNFRVWDGVWLKALPAFLRQACPDLVQRYGQSLRLVDLQVKRVLGPEWRYFPKRSYFRRHRGMGKRVGWHADADGATIFRIAASVINVWMPLDAVGSDLPSLEIVPRSHTALRGVPMLTGNNRSRDDAFVRALGPSLTPQLELGDALIFDQFVLHRTQHVGAEDALRMACEFRFVRRSAPTLQGLSGWLRFKSNNAISAGGLLAAKARNLLQSK